MANLSNINNKFIVQDNSRILVNTTSDTGATLQVGGSFSTTTSVRVGNGVLYVGDGSSTTTRIMGFGDYEMITGVSGATYLRVSGTNTLAGTLQAGQYILATGLAYGAVNSYTQIIDGSTGAITGTTATFSGIVNANAGVTDSAGDLHLGGSGSVGNLSLTSNTLATFTGNIQLADTKNLQFIGSSGDHARIVYTQGNGTTGDNWGLTFYQNSGSAAGIDFFASSEAAGDGNIRFAIGGNAKMLINNSGNVGINETAPGTLLSLAGGADESIITLKCTKNDSSWTIGDKIGGINFFSEDGSGPGAGIRGSINYISASTSGGSTAMTFNVGDNTEKMRIANGGSVGIGETSPNSLLTVGGNFTATTAKPTVSVSDMTNGGSLGIRGLSPILAFDKTSSGVPKILMDGGGLEFKDGTLDSQGSVHLKIDSSGDVLMGNTVVNPASGFSNQRGFGYDNSTGNLEIASTSGNAMTIGRNEASDGNILILRKESNVVGTLGSNTTAGNPLLDISGSSSNGNIRFVTNSSEVMRITSAYNVGIGTQDGPGDVNAKLHVYKQAGDNTVAELLRLDCGENNHNVGKGGAIVFRDINVYTDTAKIIAQRVGNSGGSTLQFSLRNSEIMRIKSDGNVGIGTTSPDHTLVVQASANTNANILAIKDSDGTRQMTVEQDSSGNGRLFVWNTSDANKVLLHTNGNSYFNGGNLGIGTTNPQNKFVVANGTDNTQNIEIAPNYIQSFNRQSGNLGYASMGFYASSYVFNSGNVGIGTSPSYELQIGGTANPKVAIVSNINSATSSLYFGDSDANDRGQIVYTHFGDFMELKTGGNTRVYLESGINTAYTSDGLYNGNATPSYWSHNNAQFKLGYMDNGSGLYSGAYSFQVKSTDGIPVTGREIGAIYIHDQSNSRKPLIISNQGRINLNQTNTSTSFGSSTGWITVQNGTGSYNFFNNYTGTDGGSGCARYKLSNTSPSFFDFYYNTTQVGYITTNGTDIFYANTSDYRLKEDLKDFDATSLLEQIQVYDFKWKESDNRMYGVVAHELQEIVPQAVVGEKDKEKFQAVDYSKLVPVLIKSIQELKAEIELLKNS